MKIKVCGITKEEHLIQLPGLGVDFAGFIFYPQSSRYVGNRLQASTVKSVGGIKKVGVFVNESKEKVLEIAAAFGLDFVQLHGDESPEYCKEMNEKIPVIKVFRIRSNSRIDKELIKYEDSSTLYLFDTDTSAFGGSGRKFSWEIFNEVEIKKPFLLSGGISHGDVEAIEKFVLSEVSKNLLALDINSQFETAPGVKDMEKIKSFVLTIKNKP